MMMRMKEKRPVFFFSFSFFRTNRKTWFSLEERMGKKVKKKKKEYEGWCHDQYC